MNLPGVLGFFAAAAMPGEVERTAWTPPRKKVDKQKRAKRRAVKASRKRNRR